MQLEYNIARVSEEETWVRNQYNKNWGNLTVLQFRKGEPTYVFASYWSLFYLGVGFVVLIYMLASGLLKEGGIELLSVATVFRVLTLLVAFIGGLTFYRINPGVASISAPIINETELAGVRDFCVECKCMQKDAIKHCTQCGVCLSSPIIHSNVFKMCITPANLVPFVALWVGLGLHSLICLLQ